MKLFEYAIVYIPLDNDGNIAHRGDTKGPNALGPRILVEPTVMLAADERAVTLKAAKEIPGNVDLDFVSVVVRPF